MAEYATILVNRGVHLVRTDQNGNDHHEVSRAHYKVYAEIDRSAGIATWYDQRRFPGERYTVSLDAVQIMP